MTKRSKGPKIHISKTGRKYFIVHDKKVYIDADMVRKEINKIYKLLKKTMKPKRKKKRRTRRNKRSEIKPFQSMIDPRFQSTAISGQQARNEDITNSLINKVNKLRAEKGKVIIPENEVHPIFTLDEKLDELLKDLPPPKAAQIKYQYKEAFNPPFNRYTGSIWYNVPNKIGRYLKKLYKKINPDEPWDSRKHLIWIQVDDNFVNVLNDLKKTQSPTKAAFIDKLTNDMFKNEYEKTHGSFITDYSDSQFKFINKIYDKVREFVPFVPKSSEESGESDIPVVNTGSSSASAYSTSLSESEPPSDEKHNPEEAEAPKLRPKKEHRKPPSKKKSTKPPNPPTPPSMEPPQEYSPEDYPDVIFIPASGSDTPVFNPNQKKIKSSKKQRMIQYSPAEEEILLQKIEAENALIFAKEQEEQALNAIYQKAKKQAAADVREQKRQRRIAKIMMGERPTSESEPIHEITTELSDPELQQAKRASEESLQARRDLVNSNEYQEQILKSFQKPSSPRTHLTNLEPLSPEQMEQEYLETLEKSQLANVESKRQSSQEHQPEMPTPTRSFFSAMGSMESAIRDTRNIIEEREKQRQRSIASIEAKLAEMTKTINTPIPEYNPFRRPRQEDSAEDSPEPYSGEGKYKATPVISKDGLYDDQIDKIMERFPDYKGSIMRDEIKKLMPLTKPHSRIAFIINTDTHDKPGMHWDAIYIDARNGPESSNSLEWYDSFGRPIPKDILEDCKLLLKMLKPETILKVKENKIVHQKDQTSNCGWFACRFLIDRFRGKSFAEATGYDDKLKINHSNHDEKEIERLKSMAPFNYIY